MLNFPPLIMEFHMYAPSSSELMFMFLDPHIIFAFASIDSTTFLEGINCNLSSFKGCALDILIKSFFMTMLGFPHSLGYIFEGMIPLM